MERGEKDKNKWSKPSQGVTNCYRSQSNGPLSGPK